MMQVESWTSALTGAFSSFGERVNKEIDEIGEIFKSSAEEFGQSVADNVNHIEANLVSATALFFLLNREKLCQQKNLYLLRCEELLGSDAEISQLLLVNALPRIINVFLVTLRTNCSLALSQAAEWESGPNGMLSLLLEVLILKAICNIASHRKLHEASGHKSESFDDHPLADTLVYLLGITNVHFEDISSRISQLPEGQNEDDIKKFFVPAIGEVLAMAFPNREEDLLLVPGIRAIIWQLLNKKILPELLYKFYQKVANVGIKKRDHAWQEIPLGGCFELFGPVMGKLVSKYLPLMLAEGADKFAVQLFAMMPESQPESLKLWLETFIRRLAVHPDKKFAKIWHLLGDKAAVGVDYFLLNLCEASEEAKYAWEEGSPLVSLFLTMTQEFKHQLMALEAECEEPSDEQLLPICKWLVSELCSKMGLRAKQVPCYETIEGLIAAELISAYRSARLAERVADSNRSQLTVKLAEACKKMSGQIVEVALKRVAYHHSTLGNALFAVIIEECATSEIYEVADFALSLKNHADELKEKIYRELLLLGKGRLSGPLQSMLEERVERLLLQLFVNMAADRADPECYEAKQKALSFHAVFIVDVFTHLLTKLCKERSKAPSESKIVQRQILEAKQSLASLLRQIKIERSKQQSEEAVLVELREKVIQVKFEIARDQNVLYGCRLARFTSNFSQRLMAVWGLNEPQALGLSQPLSEQIWHSLVTNVMPKLGIAFLNIMSDPMQLKQIALTAITTYSEVLIAVEKGKLSFPEEDPLPEDEIQSTLNASCEKLIFAMMKTMTKSWVAFPLGSKAIRKIIARKVGAVIRGQINQLMNGSVETFLEAGLTPFSKTNAFSAAMAPKLSRLANGVLSLEEQISIEDNDIAKMDAEAKLNNLLVKRSAALGVRIVKTRLGIYRIKAWWRNLQTRFDAAIKRFAGPVGLKIKRLLDVIFRAVFFTFLGTILLFPFRMIIVLLANQAEAVVNDMLKSVFLDDNLIFSSMKKSAEILVKRLDKAQLKIS